MCLKLRRKRLSTSYKKTFQSGHLRYTHHPCTSIYRNHWTPQLNRSRVTGSSNHHHHHKRCILCHFNSRFPFQGLVRFSSIFVRIFCTPTHTYPDFLLLNLRITSDSSVGKVTKLRVGCAGNRFPDGTKYLLSQASVPALRPVWPSLQWAPLVLFWPGWGVSRPRRDAGQLFLVRD